MRIAIFIMPKESKKDETPKKNAYAFEIEDEVIIPIGYTTLSFNNADYLILWLLSKQINIIYVDGIKNEIKILLNKLDIKIKKLGQITKEPFFKIFLENIKIYK